MSLDFVLHGVLDVSGHFVNFNLKLLLLVSKNKNKKYNNYILATSINEIKK